MDFIKKFAEPEGNEGQGEGRQNAGSSSEKKQGGSFFDKIGEQMNSAAGGGKESEKDEDYLDKGIDFVQEKFMGAGKQDNENAVEQAKDEQISDFIRGKYKETTGNEMPIKDKETRFG